MSELFDKPILVMVDHVGEPGNYTLTGPSKHLLKVAASLTSDQVIAVALNPTPRMDSLGACGVSRVVVPDLQGRSPRVSAVVADCVAAAAEQFTAQPVAAIMCVSNYRGREVASVLGARFRSGAAVDVTDVAVEDGTLVAKKSVLSGSWNTKFSIPSGLPIIAMRPGSGTAGKVEPVATPGIMPVKVAFSAAADAVTVESSVEQRSSGPSLTESPVVICAGYGTDGDLELVEALADRLGGAVGATRVVCDEGWVDRSRQIGQTGVTVAPKLYVGVGVSGAVHHTCGMRASERIVAVVDDPEAPLVQMADFAVIGDAQQILAQALEEL